MNESHQVENSKTNKTIEQKNRTNLIQVVLQRYIGQWRAEFLINVSQRETALYESLSQWQAELQRNVTYREESLHRRIKLLQETLQENLSKLQPNNDSVTGFELKLNNIQLQFKNMQGNDVIIILLMNN